MKVYLAKVWDHDENETEVIGVYDSEQAAVEALIDDFEMLWETAEEPRPKNLEELNALMDWVASVEEATLHS